MNKTRDQHSQVLEQILEIARQMEPLGYAFAFLGGSVLHRFSQMV
jgi:hypothetical protein